MDLDTIIKNCKKGSRKHQSVLYEQYKDALFALSLKYCATKEAAQDNLQDAFIDIFKSIKKYKHKGSFEGWIKRITINKAIDSFKKNCKTKSGVCDNDVIDDFEIEPIDDIPVDIILKFIQNLPDQYRMVFNLYELDNYPHKEIASLLSISVGTSKSNLSRAKQLLKKNIQEYRMTNNEQ